MNPLELPRQIYERLLDEARQALPNECCGLLAGSGGRATEIFPATNELASPFEFEIPPRELFEIFRAMREKSLALVGIYHSHPSGDNAPSRRDLERAYYPEAVYVILSPAADAEAPVRAFRLADDDWQEIPVRVHD